MTTIPSPGEAHELRVLFAGNPIIDLVEQALRDAGAGNLASAEVALRLWPHTAELTDRERRAVLARFMDDA